MWKITNDEVSLRLDRFLQDKYPYKSRSHIKHWIEDGIVKVNDKIVKSGYSLRLNDEVVVGEIVEKVADARPQDIPIDIVYEDDDIAIINKEQGMVVHPAVKNLTRKVRSSLNRGFQMEEHCC